ncbi:YccF domain-containing protein [Aggregatilineales bacterium SYSU G02658]
MSLLGNIIWLVFGGLPAAITYFLGGIGLCLGIVTIPWGLMTIKLGFEVLLPFGKQVVSRERTTGCISMAASVIWILFAGWMLALMHLGLGILLAVTVIGLPFAMQHFKLIPVALDPFGYELVEIY